MIVHAYLILLLDSSQSDAEESLWAMIDNSLKAL